MVTIGHRLVLGAAVAVVATGLLPRQAPAQARRACRVSEVQVTPDNHQIPVGTRYPFVATAFTTAGSSCDDATFTWSSSNMNVVAIDRDGYATGVGPGTTEITARTGAGAAARTGRATVVVLAPGGAVTQQAARIPGLAPVVGRPQGPGYAAYDRQQEGNGAADGLNIDPLRLTLIRGESRYLSFQAVRADGGNAQRVPILFTVDPGGERIVTVDTLGRVTSLGDLGTATIRAIVPANARIQPVRIGVEVRGDAPRFNRSVLSLVPGSVETLSVFVESPGQGRRAIDHAGLFGFRSSDSTRVRVHPTEPYVEALAPGRARISAASSIYDSVYAWIYVHPRVARLTMSKTVPEIVLAVGGTDTLRATAAGEDGNRVADAPLTWSMPDTAVVAFDSATGLLRGRRSGRTVVGVSAPITRDEGLTASIRVRVVAGGLSIARRAFGLGVGERAALDVGLLDESGARLMSANEYITWRSSADTIARVENHQVIAVRPGRARLTGQSRWDSTVTVDVTVAGDMVVPVQLEGRWDLQVATENGARLQPITSDSLVESHVAWSPDLQWLAVTAGAPQPANSRLPSTSTLYLMRPNGQDRVRITSDSALARAPMWVPGDRPRIVFEWSMGGTSQIWMHTLDSLRRPGTSTQLTTAAAPATAPAVSPDGQRVAFLSARPTSPGSRPTPGIFQVDLSGGDERPLYTRSNVQIAQPVYAPQGGAIYFLRTEGGGRNMRKRVWRMPIGGAPTDTAVAVTPETVIVDEYAVTPDGQTILARQLEAGPNNSTTVRIVAIRLPGGEVTPLALPAGVNARVPAPRPPTQPAGAPR